MCIWCFAVGMSLSRLNIGLFEELDLVGEIPMVLPFIEKLKSGNRLISNTLFLLPFKFSVDSEKFFEVEVKLTRTSPALSLVMLDLSMRDERIRCSANLWFGEDEFSSSKGLSLPGKRDCCELISSPDPLINLRDSLNSEHDT